MERGELDSERSGRVKAAIGLFGERITEGNSKSKNMQTDFSEVKGK